MELGVFLIEIGAVRFVNFFNEVVVPVSEIKYFDFTTKKCKLILKDSMEDIIFSEVQSKKLLEKINESKVP